MTKGTRLQAFLGLLLLLTACDAAAASPGPTCASSSPHPGYLVQLCLTAPLAGSILSGNRPITASVLTSGSAPLVNGVTFTLDGTYLTFDGQAPYTFTLHTHLYTPGPHTLAAAVAFANGDVSTAVSIPTYVAASSPPPAPPPFQPTPGREAAPGQPFVVAATGDGASGLAAEQQVADLIAGWQPNLFLYLGDVYRHGSAEDYLNWYGDGQSLYSRFRTITDPTVGNHEFELDRRGRAYFDYWGGAPSYYSVDTHGWHVVVLDNASPGVDLRAGSPQYRWLSAELTAHPNPCTIITYHRPRFNLDEEGPAPDFDAFWRLIADHHVPLVINGHAHNYQRWKPLNADGQVADGGTTQFVAGTGGQWISTLESNDPRLAIGFDSTATAWGALRLTLSAVGAHYAFVSRAGVTEDEGFVPCAPA
ncbi:Ig-like domain-containing protein [Pseudonocardia halophobica]|uniref:Ig-like domain-containing protein n=1 Tax=Pseudonocardia halophobica TaxID=29401 RepID=UPI003D927C8D